MTSRNFGNLIKKMNSEKFQNFKTYFYAFSKYRSEKKTMNKRTVIRNDRNDRNDRQRNDRKKMMY